MRTVSGSRPKCADKNRERSGWKRFGACKASRMLPKLSERTGTGMLKNAQELFHVVLRVFGEHPLFRFFGVGALDTR